MGITLSCSNDSTWGNLIPPLPANSSLSFAETAGRWTELAFLGRTSALAHREGIQDGEDFHQQEQNGIFVGPALACRCVITELWNGFGWKELLKLI